MKFIFLLLVSVVLMNVNAKGVQMIPNSCHAQERFSYWKYYSGGVPEKFTGMTGERGTSGVHSNPNTKRSGGCWLYYGGGFGLTINHRGWVKRGTRKSVEYWKLQRGRTTLWKKTPVFFKLIRQSNFKMEHFSAISLTNSTVFALLKARDWLCNALFLFFYKEIKHILILISNP